MKYIGLRESPINIYFQILTSLYCSSSLIPPRIVINPPNIANGAMILANLRVGSIIIAIEMTNAQNGQMSNNKPLEVIIPLSFPFDQKSVN
jgi:hypothetical protein